jgi:hypothetical protein
VDEDDVEESPMLDSMIFDGDGYEERSLRKERAIYESEGDVIG